jgi:hypothetical protein
MTIDLESAAVPLDQGLGDEQPHAAALVTPRQDILNLDEGAAKVREPSRPSKRAYRGRHLLSIQISKHASKTRAILFVIQGAAFVSAHRSG